RLRTATLVVLLLLSAGCYERDDKYTINPDGSGKCRVDVRLGLHESLTTHPTHERLPPQADARRVAMEILEVSKGVDAWRDVAYSLDRDGMVHFVGTAYFKNLADFVNIRNDILVPSWEKDPAGGYVLALKTPQAQVVPSGSPAMTEEQANQ